MKKIFKVIMALTLTTAMFTGCGIKFGAESRNNNWFTKNSDDSQESISSKNVNISESIEGITNLDISIDVSNVDIKYYDGTNLEISGVLSKYSKGLKVEKKSNKFVIKEESNQNKNINPDNSSNIEINIPRSFNGDLEVDFGVGDCKINDLEVNNMSITTGVGELSLKEISFNKLELESGVGEISLETKKKTGDITIEGGVGEIYVSLGDINGNLKLDGGVGSATIKVPTDAPINISTNAGLGGSNISAKTSNEAKFNFDIKMGIGEVEVTN